MPSAGELLRSERLKKNRTLADIAEQTCISRRYLEAIETDSTKDLPGEFFYRAFIRQYAKALELDEVTTNRIVSSALPLDEPDPLPVLSEAYERAHASERDRWRPPTGVAVGLLLAVVAAGSGLYAWWQRAQAPSENVGQPITRQQQASALPESVTPQPPPQQPSAVEPAPVSAPPAEAQPQAQATATPAPEQPTIAPGQPVVEITANEPAWVQLSSEGKTVFIGVLEPNQPRQFPTGAMATLRTGNAGGIDVKWTGKPVGALGPKGQVRVVRFTPEGAEVVPPKPKVVPADPAPEP